MSFATDVKKELCLKVIEKATAKAELCGMLLASRAFSFDKIFLQTGSIDSANRFVDLLRKIFDITEEIIEGGKERKVYRVCVSKECDRKRIIFGLGYKKGETICLKPEMQKIEGGINAIIRGAFLTGGNISNPEKEYRIEFSFKEKDTAEQFKTIFLSKKLNLTLTERAGKWLLYTKDSNTIEDLLTIMGAGGETLNLIGVKIYKSVRNKSNRQNNCETSNILKTADAAYKQTTAIQKLKSKGLLKTLPEELYEVAMLRLENPELSLSSLCKLSSSRLTRSGFNHRMKRILELVKEEE